MRTEKRNKIRGIILLFLLISTTIAAFFIAGRTEPEFEERACFFFEKGFKELPEAEQTFVIVIDIIIFTTAAISLIITIIYIMINIKDYSLKELFDDSIDIDDDYIY